MKKRIRKYDGDSLILKRKREKEWRDDNRLSGLCSCGRSTPAQGRKSCQKCIDSANTRRMMRRNSRKQLHVCPECSSETNGKTLCEKCHNSRKSRADTTRQKRLEANSCTRCGKSSSIYKLKYCLTCLLKCLAFNVWKDRTRWQELLDLFNQQLGICPYFKEPITIGLNASLDHRIPKILGGSNDISNLQWVHNVANTMKWDLTEAEFHFYISKLSKSLDI